MNARIEICRITVGRAGRQNAMGMLDTGGCQGSQLDRHEHARPRNDRLRFGQVNVRISCRRGVKLVSCITQVS